MHFDAVPIVIFIVIAVIVKVLSDNRVRRLAIEKGIVNEDMKFLYSDRFEGKVPSSLKWGFVLIGIGLALFIGQMAPSSITEEITVGGMFFFAGVGLVIYYFVANRIYKKAKQEEAK
ncbi:MAG TPA: DUF6249 domain-containing protein [bacterium]